MTPPTPEELEAAAKLLCEMNADKNDPRWGYHIAKADLLYHAQCAEALRQVMGRADGGRTGWPPGMLQDDSRELSKALASKPDAKLHAREAAGLIGMEAQLIEERDSYHDIADRLANAISEYFDVEIGEHSSANDPWMRALEAISQASQQSAAWHTEEHPQGHLSSDAEAVHKCLDDAGVVRHDDGKELSLWGRVVRYAAPQASQQAEKVEPEIDTTLMTPQGLARWKAASPAQPAPEGEEPVVGQLGWARVRVDTKPDKDGWCYATPETSPTEIKIGASTFYDDHQFFCRVVLNCPARALTPEVLDELVRDSERECMGSTLDGIEVLSTRIKRWLAEGK
jgi:hypothetical protein